MNDQMKNSQFGGDTDRSLVLSFLRTRDEMAFRELYRHHTPALYSLALRLVGGSEADSQDVIQETWVRACKMLPGFEWNSSLKTWLSGILINCAREFCRKRHRRSEEQLTDEFLSTIAGWTAEGMGLDQIIARLPQGYRHVLVLHDIEGYTHEEISALLEISVGTSKSQLYHARKAVRAVLETEK